MPSSPEPTISHSDDLDFFKDFENKFPDITYNDDLTSKLTEPSIWYLYHLEIRDTSSSDFVGLTEGMRQTLGDRLRMVYTGDEGHELFTSHAWRRLFEIKAPILGEVRRRMTWRQFILALGLHTATEMAEVGFGAYWLGSERVIPDKGDLRDYWIEILFDRDFLGPPPSYVYIRDPMRRLCHRMIAYSISGKGHAPENVTEIDLFYLRSMDREMANVPYLHLAAHFGLVGDEGLRGLSVITHELQMIDLHELVRLNICVRLSDTWAWVASGPKRQQVATAGALEAGEDALADVEGVSAAPAPGNNVRWWMRWPETSPDSPYRQPEDAIRRPCCEEIDDMVYSEKDVC
ncbi:hypothetical protein Tco_1325333 [Tanacetum coccineum]